VHIGRVQRVQLCAAQKQGLKVGPLVRPPASGILAMEISFPFKIGGLEAPWRGVL